MENLTVTYNTIKTILNTIPSYYIAQGDSGYSLYSIGETLFIHCTILGTETSNISDFETNYKSLCVSASSADDAKVLGSVANKLPFITPRSPDGRFNYLPNLFPLNTQVYIPGIGDDSISGRGKGTQFIHSSDDGYATSHTIEWYFNDWIYLAGGHIMYQGAVLGDTIDYILHAPATVTTVVSGSGNVNCVGPGNVLIIPGVSTNTNADLTKAVPVPNLTGTGFWDWSLPDTGLGTITPNLSQKGSYDLYTIDITLSHFACSYPLLGTNVVDLTMPALLPKRCLPQWIHKVIVYNSGHNGLQIVWSLITARVKTT